MLSARFLTDAGFDSEHSGEVQAMLFDAAHGFHVFASGSSASSSGSGAAAAGPSGPTASATRD